MVQPRGGSVEWAVDGTRAVHRSVPNRRIRCVSAKRVALLDFASVLLPLATRDSDSYAASALASVAVGAVIKHSLDALTRCAIAALETLLWTQSRPTEAARAVPHVQPYASPKNYPRT